MERKSWCIWSHHEIPNIYNTISFNWWKRAICWVPGEQETSSSIKTNTINLFSKKDSEIRQKELFDYCKSYFLEYFTENMLSALKDGFQGFMMTEMIERLARKLNIFSREFLSFSMFVSSRWWSNKILYIIEYCFEYIIVRTSSRNEFHWTSNLAQCSSTFDYRRWKTTKEASTRNKFELMFIIFSAGNLLF